MPSIKELLEGQKTIFKNSEERRHAAKKTKTRKPAAVRKGGEQTVSGASGVPASKGQAAE